LAIWPGGPQTQSLKCLRSDRAQVDGSLVMNTQEELREAIEELERGTFLR
jgi:redox-sensitive bicupin YhaK (pirin superfamily)